MAEGAQQRQQQRGFDAPLTLADQAFVNFAGVLTFFTPDHHDRVMAEEIARDLVPMVNRKHQYLAPIVEAFEDAAPDAPQSSRATALTRLSHHMARFMRWRGAQAYERLQGQGLVR
ncbi:MAG: hypothetical protein ACK4LQ_02200 [Pararhodobacter sp.]